MSLPNPHSRRRFLSRSLTAAAAALPAPSRAELDPGQLKTFRSRLRGRAVLRGDSAYDKARRIFFWNPDTERRPALVVHCSHTDDILRAVEFARKHDLEFAVRGGGHSPMGWGTSNGLVVDLTGMNGATVDPARRTVRIDGGILGGDVMRAAGLHGLAPVLGQCPGVGAAGVTLGGGLGWLSGLHGACCDNLLSVRLVTADSRVLTADAERSPDLLWALKGAGGNFGVAASLVLRLHPIGPVTAGDVYYPVRQTRTVLRFFRDLMAEAPDGFQATINLTPNERGAFITFCHSGDASEAERLLRALRAAATPSKESVARQPFADLAARYPVAAANAAFRCTANAYRSDFSDDLIESTLDCVAHAPSETVLGLSHYTHGEVCRIKPESAAFPLRQSGGIHIRIGMDWNDPTSSERLMGWAENTRLALRPASAERIYANYQSQAGSGTPEAVYGGNYSRLIAVKKKYDPTNFFRRNSNVVP